MGWPQYLMAFAGDIGRIGTSLGGAGGCMRVQFLLSTTKPLCLHGCGMRTGSSLPRRAVEGPQVMDARWGNSAILQNFEEGGG